MAVLMMQVIKTQTVMVSKMEMIHVLLKRKQTMVTKTRMAVLIKNQ